MDQERKRRRKRRTNKNKTKKKERETRKSEVSSTGGSDRTGPDADVPCSRRNHEAKKKTKKGKKNAWQIAGFPTSRMQCFISLHQQLFVSTSFDGYYLIRIYVVFLPAGSIHAAVFAQVAGCGTFLKFSTHLW